MDTNRQIEANKIQKMCRYWQLDELVLLQAWKMAEGSQSNDLILAALKSYSYHRFMEQIERKKQEFIRVYVFVKPHLEL